MTVTRDEAETIAFAALGFLASDPARFERFLDVTGLTLQAVQRGVATDAAIQAAILDYIFRDDALLTGLALAANTQAETVYDALRTLDPTFEAEPPSMRTRVSKPFRSRTP